jgi:hypothetical protein
MHMIYFVVHLLIYLFVYLFICLLVYLYICLFAANLAKTQEQYISRLTSI